MDNTEQFNTLMTDKANTTYSCEVTNKITFKAPMTFEQAMIRAAGQSFLHAPKECILRDDRRIVARITCRVPTLEQVVETNRDELEDHARKEDVV